MSFISSLQHGTGPRTPLPRSRRMPPSEAGKRGCLAGLLPHWWTEDFNEFFKKTIKKSQKHGHWTTATYEKIRPGNSWLISQEKPSEFNSQGKLFGGCMGKAVTVTAA